ncbi:MAG: hypothetical protein ABUL42_01120 [Terricaulis silvestris]
MPPPRRRLPVSKEQFEMRKSGSAGALVLSTLTFCFYLAAAFVILLVTNAPALTFSASEWRSHV